MDNNEAFQNWFESKLAESRANNDLDMHRNLTRYVGFYKYGFEAAQQQSAGEIAELTEKLERKKSYALAITEAIIEKDMTINVLKADNERLRKALEVCKWDCNTGEVIQIAAEALAKTPVQ